MRVAVLLLVLMQSLMAVADGDTWEQYLTELYENDEEAVVSMEEAYEHLNELAQQPLDINAATQQDLMQIPGLNQDQINDILQYIHRYGKMRSIEELAMIESIGLRLRNYLQCFLMAEDEAAKPWYGKERLGKSLKNIRHSIVMTVNTPTYYRAGDQKAPSHTYLGDNRYAGKYLGDPVSHSLRYSLKVGENATFNLSGGKSAGEPFGGEHNRWGYDRYAFNLSLTRVGRFSHIVLGQFRAQFGMGLVLNNNFTLGKQGMLAAVGRRLTSFTPHSSISDSRHFQGAAAMVRLTSRLQLAGFFSYRRIDATLNPDSTISTILTSGYHRTALEMDKKNNSALIATGAHLSYERRQWGVGVSALYSWLDRDLNPTYSKSGEVRQSQLYRQYQPHGNRFWNIGADYRYRWRDIAFNGETAVDKDFNLATINSLTWRTPRNLTLMALQRYYTYQYNTLFGSSFSDGGRVNNESGLYVGAQWNAGKGVVVGGYTDIAYFPWYRYLVSASSYSWDNSLTGSWTRGKWSLSLRYRIKMKQRDKTVDKHRRLLTRYDQRLRLLAIYNNDRWSLRTQVEGCSLSFDESTKGCILSQSAAYKPLDCMEIYANLAYFNTDDYDSRLYAYERSMRYSFGFSSYYGRGAHAALMLKYRLLSRLTLQGKVSHTRYFDRETIGTAERMIFSSHYTDIDLQVQLKL